MKEKEIEIEKTKKRGEEFTSLPIEEQIKTLYDMVLEISNDIKSLKTDNKFIKMDIDSLQYDVRYCN